MLLVCELSHKWLGVGEIVCYLGTLDYARASIKAVPFLHDFYAHSSLTVTVFFGVEQPDWEL